MPQLSHVGTTLSSPQPRACGLCGDVRKLSRAHVPPQVAGNSTRVERAPDVIDAGTRRPGRWTEGGMWVRGLCERCNNLAGTVYDNAYADFAAQVARLTSPIALRMQVIPGEPPGARFAPGLVARCVLYSMFAINPRLRILYPDLAYGMSHETAPGYGPIRWPVQLRLLVGRSHPRLRCTGVVSSGVWAMRVLNERVVHHSFGDIVFPPLTWTLVPADTRSERDGLGPQITKHLGDASDWINYGPDRVLVDLRTICQRFPAIALPYSSSVMTGSSCCRRRRTESVRSLSTAASQRDARSCRLPGSAEPSIRPGSGGTRPVQDRRSGRCTDGGMSGRLVRRGLRGGMTHLSTLDRAGSLHLLAA